MRTASSTAELRAVTDAWRRDGATVGFVPTMGYLHDGHVSLIRAAVAQCDRVVVSIFVNPLQFAPSEDLDSYPSDVDGDSAKARAAGADLMFIPLVTEMYPDGRDGVLTTVAVPGLAGRMEGASRPTHFAGVCTVVTKLFNMVGACTAYFGEKDYQQLAIIRRMAHDLSMPVTVVGCETVREPDGLAMSSRNVYLSEAERASAPVLNRALRTGAEAIASGEADRARVLDVMRAVLDSEPLATLDYLEIADPDTLVPADPVGPGCRIFGAVTFSKARLIDNLPANLHGRTDGSGS